MAKKRPPARQARSGEKERIHFHMPTTTLKLVDRAAKGEGVSRSSFIAGAAHAKAIAVLSKGAR